MADGPTSLDDFTPEQLNALQDIAQARIDDSLSRRDALKALGMVGGGAATGAIGGATLTQGAKADASTTDSDGDVGQPNDRVDGFFDGVDATSVSADETQNKNYVEPQVTTTEGTSYTADLSTANYHKITLTGDVSVGLSNVDATDTNSVVLHLVQDSTGGRTPSFVPTVVWDGGSAPSWSTSASAEDVITLVHDQDGSQWLGFVGGIGMA